MKPQTDLPSCTPPVDIESEVARTLRVVVGYLEMRQSQMEVDFLLRWAICGVFLGAVLAAIGYAALYPTSYRLARRVPHLIGPQRVHLPRVPDFVLSVADPKEIRCSSQD